MEIILKSNPTLIIRLLFCFQVCKARLTRSSSRFVCPTGNMILQNTCQFLVIALIWNGFGFNFQYLELIAVSLLAAIVKFSCKCGAGGLQVGADAHGYILDSIRFDEGGNCFNNHHITMVKWPNLLKTLRAHC